MGEFTGLWNKAALTHCLPQQSNMGSQKGSTFLIFIAMLEVYQNKGACASKPHQPGKANSELEAIPLLQNLP